MACDGIGPMLVTLRGPSAVGPFALGVARNFLACICDAARADVLPGVVARPAAPGPAAGVVFRVPAAAAGRGFAADGWCA